MKIYCPLCGLSNGFDFEVTVNDRIDIKCRRCRFVTYVKVIDRYSPIVED